MKKLTQSLFLLHIFGIFSAQLSQYNRDEDLVYQQATELYFNEAYRASAYDFSNLMHFSSLSAMQEEYATFYRTITSLLYNDAFAESQLKNFQANYPESNLLSQAHFPLGKYYLHQNNFEKALREFQQINPAELSSNNWNEYYFSLAYAQFMSNYFTAAQQSLEKMTDDEKYSAAKHYMLGHIAYTNGNFDEATTEFEAIKDVDNYSEITKPYLVQIYFNQKKYEQAVNEGENLLRSNQYPELKAELSKIVGESYFQQKNYKRALPLLKYYLDTSKKAVAADYYQLGFVQYKEKNYTEAVKNFNQITNEKSAFAQNAFYQLGNSYLKIKKKYEALTAFKSSSEMNFDKKIQHNAFYNYAKLSYEIGNPFESVSQVLQKYQNNYPNSDKKSEINTLLLKSYLKSKNYSGALEALANISNKSSEEKNIEQEVSLLYGIQLYNSKEYSKAITILPKSFENRTNEFAAKGLFWFAESHYHLENYDKAIVALQQMEKLKTNAEEQKEIPYALGYNYLKIRKFDQAIVAFEKYLTDENATQKNDAEIRLADAYYGADNYEKALLHYGTVSSTNDEVAEEATFNSAMILGYKGDTQKKIIELENFIKKYPKSEWFDDANYELGVSYQMKEDYNNSNKYFNKVINDKKEIELVALSMLGRANNYAQLNENERALNEYKTIAKEFKNSDYSAQAVIAAKSIYVKQGKIKEYETWAQSTGYNLSTEEKEELSFTNAQNVYLENNFDKAIELLNDFINYYPNSNRLITAKYYLGNSYYKTNDFTNAKTQLTIIASQPNQYQEDALAQLGQIYVKEGDDKQAKFALEALLQITQNNNYINFADLELMYIYSTEKNHKQAKIKAEKVLKNNKISDIVKEEAQLIIARAKFAENDNKGAKADFVSLEKSKNANVKAEALYHKALFLNKEKKYENSNKVLFTIASELSDQAYFGAKSLVLMADNYNKLKDKYQATYILEQVLNDYKEFPDVIKEAETLLNQIKSE